MINNLDIIPEYFMINDFKGCKDGSIIYVMQNKIVFHTLFLITSNASSKNLEYLAISFFVKTIKTKI